MTVGASSTLADVAFLVGTALHRAGIEAVLTGGACASIHADEAYVSHDLDFVLRGRTTQPRLDAALAALGFHRTGDRYVHPDLALYIEFPPGPLAVWGDHTITPVELRRGSCVLRTLSPTDACRDRLAAFYHWDDRQSLRLAVAIATHQRVNQRKIASWSQAEGHAVKFAEFQKELRRTT